MANTFQSQPPHNDFKTSSARSTHLGMVLMWMLLGVYLFSVWHPQDNPSIAYSRFKSNLVGENVAQIHVRGEEISGIFRQPIKLGGDDE